ncbi:MAG: FimV/HubP family polar landmark protein [Lysobacteraceae bacterium]
MRKMIRLPMALALALGTSPIFAMGFGQIQVKSNLNEPLLAEIPILSASAAEVAELSVKLAPREAFERIGLDRPNAALLDDLVFEVVETSDGSAVVRIRSSGRINEPFISLLLEAEWARGKLLREYTMLIDPPLMARGAPAQVMPLAEAPVAPAEVTETPLDTPPPITAAAANTAPATPSVPRYVAGESYGPVGDGQALWNIALETRPDSGVDVNQMMLALLRANPDAFINGNVNRLRKGAVLRIPSRDDIVSVSAAQAAMQVREQTGAASVSTTSTVQPADSAASITADSPPVERAESRLALVPPSGSNEATGAQSGASNAGGGAELRAELSRSKEQVETLDQENSELRSRVQELEKIREDSERLLSMRDSELQALQQRLAELEAQRVEAANAASGASSSTDAASTPPASEEASTVLPVDPPVTEPIATDAAVATDGTATDADVTTDTMTTTDDMDEPLADTSAQTPTATESPAQQPAVTPSAETPTEPVAQAWYQNYAVLGGGAAVLLALIALIARRKRGGSGTAGNASRLDVSALGLPGNENEQAADSDDLISDRENELLQQLAEQPDDLTRHLELVRYYFERADAQHFEGAAEAMYAQVYDSEDPAWQETLAMGRELLPDHPLFVVYGGASLVSASEADDHVDVVDSSEVKTAEISFPDDFADASAPAVTAPAFEAPSLHENDATSPPSFDAELSLADDAHLDSLSAGLDFDQEAQEFGDRLRSAELTVGTIDLADASLDMPDFSRDSLSIEPTTSSQSGDAVDAVDQSDDLGIDLGNEDAAATKLELARAYLDMGDVEGARGMLEEVTGEGSPAQRAEARGLLDSIR